MIYQKENGGVLKSMLFKKEVTKKQLHYVCIYKNKMLTSLSHQSKIKQC